MPEQAPDAGAELYSRLHSRRPELEAAAFTRIRAIADPTEVADLTYLDGLRAAVSAAVDYGLAGIEGGDRHGAAIPAALLTQARVAARAGVSLDAVLRRYFAGYSLLGDFLIEEADSDLVEAAELKGLLRAQATRFDRLLAAVSDEYGREAGSSPTSAAQRRLERVQKLLDGELLDTAELAYDFEAFHLAAVAVGEGAAQDLRNLAEALGRRLLLVRPGEGRAWAWLGGKRKPNLAELPTGWPANATVSLGEPGHGLAGWRLTHCQAAAALPIALRTGQGLTRYADVALLASMFQDDLLIASLRQLYLDPLAQERNGGRALQETLRAYFATDRNVSSTAAALGVTRQTVNNRLRTIERRLGRPLNTCAAEVEAALRLEEFSPLAPGAQGVKSLAPDFVTSARRGVQTP